MIISCWFITRSRIQVIHCKYKNIVYCRLKLSYNNNWSQEDEPCLIAKCELLPAFNYMLHIHPGRTCSHYALLSASSFHSVFSLLSPCFSFSPSPSVSQGHSHGGLWINLWRDHQDSEAKRSRVFPICFRPICSWTTRMPSLSHHLTSVNAARSDKFSLSEIIAFAS